MLPPCPAPRLCHLTKQPCFDGYGFNLHAERGRPGQFVGLIDEDSPAEDSGIRRGDRIVEVNGVNVSAENHKDVVERIKTNHSSTTLLVSDYACDTYHREHGLEVTSFLPYILHLYSNTATAEEKDTLLTRAGTQCRGVQPGGPAVPAGQVNSVPLYQDEVDWTHL